MRILSIVFLLSGASLLAYDKPVWVICLAALCLDGWFHLMHMGEE